MQFDGIIKSVQDRYDLDEVFRTSSCEYEEWDSPEKLCHLLFSAIPIIGEAKLSDEQISDFNKRGQHLFLKLITQGETSLSILERQMLSAAVIMHVQQLDDNAQESEETDSQLWDYILARVGYSESLCSKTTAYNRLRDVVHSTVHYATTHGKKYYNTLRIQALAPASSIFGLYNIIYRFYRVNLECQYEEAENAFLILAENIRKKVLKDSTSDDIKLDSSVWTLKSSIKVLFQYQPGYMAAVCDAITQKMDLKLRGDHPQLCSCNRWDSLLQKWFDDKTAEEREAMSSVRAKRISQRIATRRETIRPDFILKGNELSIVLPNIRLPEITQRPTIMLYQNSRLVSSSKMSVYGDEMCYTTRSFSFDLNQIADVRNNESLNFQIKIECGDATVYDSRTDLYRDYLIFNESGIESSLSKCQNGVITLVTSTSTLVEIIDPEDEYFDESSVFQQVRASLLSAKSINVNHIDILTTELSDTAMRCYCVPEAISGAVAISDGVQYRIFDKPPKLHIFTGKDFHAQEYQIILDSSHHSLYEYCANGTIEDISLPQAARFCHKISIREFNSGKEVFSTQYIVLPNFYYSFSEPYYFNREECGTITVKSSGITRKTNFTLCENQTSIEIPLIENQISVQYEIPKVDILVDGENILYWPKNKWYDEISQSSFIKVSSPKGVNLSFFIGGTNIPKVSRGNAYELGNTLRVIEKAESAILGIIVRHGSNCKDLGLTEIHFKPFFLSSPVTREGSKLIWQPEQKFIGPDNPSFYVDLENDSGDPWHYIDLQNEKPFEKNYSCRPGKYQCRIFLESKQSSPFAKTPDPELVWEETFSFIENVKDRYLNSAIQLTRAYFWSPLSEKNTFAPIYYNTAVIDRIEYLGLSTFDDTLDEPTLTYRGYLYFNTANGWIRMNDAIDNPDYVPINPVEFCVQPNGRLKVAAADGEPLYLNEKSYQTNRYIRICAKRDEIRENPTFADEFDFREEINE